MLSMIGRRRKATLVTSVLLAGAVALAAAAAACASVGHVGAHAKKASGPILIGALYSQTGETAPDGIPDLQGLSAAVKAINASGGIGGRKIKLITENPESSVSQAVEDTKTLIQDHVTAMFGPESTSEVPSLIPLVNAAHLPTLTNEGGIPLTNQDGYVFEPENPVSSGPAGAVVEEDIAYMKAHHLNKFAYISSASAQGQATDRFALPIFKKSGLNMVADLSVDPNATDYTQQFQQAKSDGAQTVFFSQSGSAAAIALKDYVAVGFPFSKIFLLAMSQPQIASMGPQATDVLVAQQPADVATQVPKSYVGYSQLHRWVVFARAHHLSPSDHFAAQGWDFMGFLAASIEKVGASRNALYKLWTSGRFTYNSMAGPIRMTAKNHGGLSAPYDVMTEPDPTTDSFYLVRN